MGKTSFIKYLLERDFPGIRIGPEPTTDRWGGGHLLAFSSRGPQISKGCCDAFTSISSYPPLLTRFVAIMKGNEDRVVPGNALSVDATKPFHGVDKFGTGKGWRQACSLKYHCLNFSEKTL